MTKQECIAAMDEWDRPRAMISPRLDVATYRKALREKCHERMRYVASLPGVMSAVYDEEDHLNHIRLAPHIGFVWLPGETEEDARRIVNEALAVSMIEVTP